MKKYILIFANLIIVLFLLWGCTEYKGYGVFLSLDNDKMNTFSGYDEVVIDAQYFDAKDIELLQNNGAKVYSYLNIASIEDFRDYYNEYEKYSLGDYENWDEEKWIDVSNEVWQNFILNTLAKELYEKGIDGFFIDNTDVYYNYKSNEIYNGLVYILNNLMEYNIQVIINGGDEFINRFIEENGEIDSILTGINQEEVFTVYDFESETSVKSDDDDMEYYKSYLEKCSKLGADIYLIEYTVDSNILYDVKKYCNTNSFKYYISDSIELN